MEVTCVGEVYTSLDGDKQTGPPLRYDKIRVTLILFKTYHTVVVMTKT